MRRRTFIKGSVAAMAVSVGMGATPATAASMEGGIFAGYQGWFGCPSDAPGRGLAALVPR